jgi:Fe-S cluster assembly iron-binding protein IscA
MLTLTDQATTVVKTIADQTPEVAGVGLRISAEGAEAQQLDLSVVASPEPADQVIETDGALVFLEPNAAVLLDDKVLDARIEDDGAVSFAIGVL